MKFAEAVKSMVEYLQSEEFGRREDAVSTLSSVPRLVKIVKAGLITENSQEGVQESGVNPETRRYFEMSERAYVTGFIKKGRADAFVDWMNANTGMTALQVMSGSSKESITVTRARSHATKAGLKTAAYSSETSLPIAIPASTLNTLRSQVHLDKTEDVAYIAVFDAQYGRAASSKQGLYAAVLRGLTAI